MLKSKEFFGSDAFVVPMGVQSVKVFAVGGGGSADVSYVKVTASQGQGGGGGGAGGVVQAVVDLTQASSAFTGDMNNDRFLFAAVLLGNGKVLVIGGKTDTSAIADCELYDPTTGLWTSTGSMSIDRMGHSAVVLNDGTVLVAGGWSDSLGQTLNTSEIYDPGTGMWTLTTNAMNFDRSIYNLVLLQDGTVLAAGGFTSTTNAGQVVTEIYDPTLQTWTQVGDMIFAVGGSSNIPNMSCPAVLLPIGTVAIFGGDPGTGTPSDAIQIYDPTPQTWSSTSNMVIARGNHTATLLSTGLVLIAGGTVLEDSDLVPTQSAELYDPVGNMSAETMGFPHALNNQTAVTLADGQHVALLGGFDYTQGNGWVSNAQVFDPSDNSWAVNGVILTPRFYASSILLNTGLVLLIGGETIFSPFVNISTELYGGTITSVPVVIGAGGVGTMSGANAGSLSSFGGYVTAFGGNSGGSGNGSSGTIGVSFNGVIAGGGGGGAGSRGKNGLSYSTVVLRIFAARVNSLFQGNVGGIGTAAASPASGEQWVGGDGGAPIMVPNAVSIPWVAAGGGGGSAQKNSNVTIASGTCALTGPTTIDGAFATGSGGTAQVANNPGSGNYFIAGGNGGSGYILVTWEE